MNGFVILNRDEPIGLFCYTGFKPTYNRFQIFGLGT